MRPGLPGGEAGRQDVRKPEVERGVEAVFVGRRRVRPRIRIGVEPRPGERGQQEHDIKGFTAGDFTEGCQERGDAAGGNSCVSQCG